jgi:plasmid stabilization system protein ParE
MQKGRCRSSKPSSGSRDGVVPEFDDPALRERFVYSYRVIYRVEPHRLLIVAVIHGKRLIEPISDRFG